MSEPVNFGKHGHHALATYIANRLEDMKTSGSMTARRQDELHQGMCELERRVNAALAQDPVETSP